MNKEGFTLLEMLLVMFIITVLLLLTIPNITKQKKSVEKTGCEAYADVVETQVAAYELSENKEVSSLEELKAAGYITSTTCSDGTALVLNGSEVSVEK